MPRLKATQQRPLVFNRSQTTASRYATIAQSLLERQDEPTETPGPTADETVSSR
jgi:hypothetical protein